MPRTSSRRQWQPAGAHMVAEPPVGPANTGAPCQPAGLALVRGRDPQRLGLGHPGVSRCLPRATPVRAPRRSPGPGRTRRAESRSMIRPPSRAGRRRPAARRGFESSAGRRSSRRSTPTTPTAACRSTGKMLRDRGQEARALRRVERIHRRKSRAAVDVCRFEEPLGRAPSRRGGRERGPHGQPLRRQAPGPGPPAT